MLIFVGVEGGPMGGRSAFAPPPEGGVPPPNDSKKEPFSEQETYTNPLIWTLRGDPPAGVAMGGASDHPPARAGHRKGAS